MSKALEADDSINAPFASILWQWHRNLVEHYCFSRRIIAFNRNMARGAYCILHIGLYRSLCTWIQPNVVVAFCIQVILDKDSMDQRRKLAGHFGHTETARICGPPELLLCGQFHYVKNSIDSILSQFNSVRRQLEWTIYAPQGQFCSYWENLIVHADTREHDVNWWSPPAHHRPHHIFLGTSNWEGKEWAANSWPTKNIPLFDFVPARFYSSSVHAFFVITQQNGVFFTWREASIDLSLSIKSRSVSEP